MSKNPRVSVIIPTYNRAALLNQAIVSVLDQTFTDFELIVVDDGSTDDTPTVVSAFQDRRIRYVYQDNAGRSAARNRGIELARGEYVAFLDSDDLYLPNKLAVQVAVFERSPALGLVGGGFRQVNEKGDVLSEVCPWLRFSCLDLHTWLFACPQMPSSVMVQREWLTRVGGFDGSVETAEDWDLFLRLARAGCQMAWVEKLVSAYRIHSANSVTRASSHVRSMVAVLDKFFADSNLPAEIVVMRQEAYAAAHLKGACREYAAGEIDEAKQDLTRALELNPPQSDNKVDRVLDELIGWARDPLIGDPLSYLQRVLNNLPESAHMLRGRRRQAWARGIMGLFFDAYERRDWATVRQVLPLALRCDPSWLRNRGVISIALQAWLPWLRKRMPVSA